jgi:hypothetical protein
MEKNCAGRSNQAGPSVLPFIQTNCQRDPVFPLLTRCANIYHHQKLPSNSHHMARRAAAPIIASILMPIQIKTTEKRNKKLRKRKKSRYTDIYLLAGSPRQYNKSIFSKCDAFKTFFRNGGLAPTSALIDAYILLLFI